MFALDGVIDEMNAEFLNELNTNLRRFLDAHRQSWRAEMQPGDGIVVIRIACDYIPKAGEDKVETYCNSYIPLSMFAEDKKIEMYERFVSAPIRIVRNKLYELMELE